MDKMSAEKNISLKLWEYFFDIPKELIAQEPLAERDSSRLVVLDRVKGEIKHSFFKDILNYLNPGDCVVLNRTGVIPARVYGKKETGGKVEILFIEPKSQMVKGKYFALVKPFISPGKKVFFENGSSARIVNRLPGGESVLQLEGITIEELLNEYGVMPLPPYIKRNGCAKQNKLDKERYQTVYANEKGSIAAPTSGLHFTEEILKKIRSKGVNIAEIVLHVGRGTFRPIVSQDINKHIMLPEYYEISEDAAEIINRTMDKGGRIIACGTTSVRAIESAAEKRSSGYRIVSQKNFTDIFIYPGYTFKIAGAMITNLHLPKSTPLMMVSALAGKESILSAYKEAIKLNYRFFSYGDAMLIL